MLATLPATMMMAMASPMARPMPSTTAAAMPLEAAGTDDPEHRLDVGGAQGQAGLLILLGHRVQGGLRHGDDGGQDHDGQHDDGGRTGWRRRAGRRPPRTAGHQHHHADQAVDHRGDARQQVHRRADDGRPAWGEATLARNTAVIKPMGTPMRMAPAGAVDGGEDEGEDAELGLRSGGGPRRCRTESPPGRSPGWRAGRRRSGRC